MKNADLIPQFEQVKALLQPYAGRYQVRVDDPDRYELWTGRPAVIDGRQKGDVFFAALIIQKHYVGFYFMPVYADADLRELFGPELLTTLKGKSCFHLRKLAPEILGQIEQALQQGDRLYELRGWI
jgi:hypothetical protein